MYIHIYIYIYIYIYTHIHIHIYIYTLVNYKDLTANIAALFSLVKQNNLPRYVSLILEYLGIAESRGRPIAIMKSRGQ